MIAPRTLVDDRWRGRHGIARYSSEVLPRLTVDWAPLRAPGRPGSARDLLTPRPALAGRWIYSPGYNAGLSAAAQLVTVHDLIHLRASGRRYRLYYDRVLRPAIRRARTVLTVSGASADALAEWLGDDGVRIVDTGNGVSAAFSPGAPTGRWGIDYLVYVGNLKPHKNVGTLLDAMRRLPEHRLIAVVPDAARLREATASLGLEKRVQAVSGLTDAELADLYRGATATVLPSTLEGFGLPAAESLCCGRPVVYWSGCASIAEIVAADGIAVSSPHDADAWAEGIRAASALPPVDASRARRRFAWERVADRVDETLRGLLQGGGA